MGNNKKSENCEKKFCVCNAFVFIVAIVSYGFLDKGFFLLDSFLKNCNLEVGFGWGDILVHMARNNPNKNFIGLETYLNGISITLRNSIEKKLSNIKLVHNDVLVFLESLKQKVLFENIFFFFPDPWPKKRHNKRRLINLKNLDYFYDFLSDNGNLYILTDDQDYAERKEDYIKKQPC